MNQSSQNMLPFIVYIRKKMFLSSPSIGETAVRKGRSKTEKRMGKRKRNSSVETILYLLCTVLQGILLFVFPCAYMHYFFHKYLEMNLLGHILSVFSTLIDIFNLFYNVVVLFKHSPAVCEMSCHNETVKWYPTGLKSEFP